jgi:pimeloyl-ACP methyl ester carboxylesterase
VVQGADEERDGVGNAVKISKITTPTLIIHAQEDMLIPVGQGLLLHRYCAAQDKHLVLISNAGHNTLMMVGRSQYFDAIQKFVSS